MKRIFLIFLFLAVSNLAWSQDNTVQDLKKSSEKNIEKNPADTTKKTWKTGGMVSLNLAQASFDNWVTGGGVNSFSLVALSKLYAFYKKDRHSWDNFLEMGYGFVNTQGIGNRKSDDRLDLTSKYGYAVAKHWNFSALMNFRTQFTEGLDYPKPDSSVRNSTFLAPAFLLLSLGFEYKPDDHFSLFISPITQRWVIVQDDFLSAKGAFGVKPGSKSRSETGAFLSARYNREIVKNITYTGRLDLFSNYKENPGNIDVFWTNLLTMKVNKFISATLAIDFIYDDNAIKRLQRRQLIGVGISASF